MNHPEERLAARADNLARLLSDERGAEILAELQKLALVTGSRQAAANGPRATAGTEPDAAAVGPWDVVHTDGTTIMRRRPLPVDEARTWADVADIALSDTAERVVLLGESSARGFLLDPVFNPALALQRRLDDAAPGAHQCIDLAQTGQSLRELMTLVGRLPALRPDVIVVYAGNNWVLPQHTPAHLDLLATSLRNGDYATMRDAFLDGIVAPEAQRLLNRLAQVARSCEARVVLVVPEFNLRGWTPDPELEFPPLAPDDLTRWSGLRRRAEDARARGEAASVLTLTEEMAALDRGLSPATGWLRASAARTLGRTADEERALEAARDAAAGLLTTHTPRVTSALRAAMADTGARLGFRCVDLGALLRHRSPHALPEPSYFLDYCHLSDQGIELLAAAVTDAVRGLPEGTTAPGPGAPGTARAMSFLLAAVHNSFYGQPEERVAELARAAVRGVPETAQALHDVLEADGPVWTHPAVKTLVADPQANRYLAPMLTRQAETLGMWSLRTCLRREIGRVPRPGAPGRANGAERAPGPQARPGPTDLLAAVEQGLIDGAFRPPNHLPERSYLQCFGRTSTLVLELPQAVSGEVTLVYRTPETIDRTAAAAVLANGTEIGKLPAAMGGWRCLRLAVPASAVRPGGNRLVIHWPLGGARWQARRTSDAAALARSEFPMVLPVQGELFEAVFAPHTTTDA
ncbi:hypothetical protein [Streptomyces sp. NPDC021356]|uniref:hypothetical protein n=1 Tax=Streptomyces sp. NPDC021356 TaxID=3154900 RepID=UPI0034054C98